MRLHDEIRLTVLKAGSQTALGCHLLSKVTSGSSLRAGRGMGFSVWALEMFETYLELRDELVCEAIAILPHQS